jgi:hypothetical protein
MKTLSIQLLALSNLLIFCFYLYSFRSKSDLNEEGSAAVVSDYSNKIRIRPTKYIFFLKIRSYSFVKS